MEDQNNGYLLTALHLRRGSVVSLIGAGGKTTTMLSLAEEIRHAGWTCIITTTTKIWPPPDLPLLFASDLDDVVSTVSRELTEARVLALGARLGPEGKVHGLAPETICHLAAERVTDIILVEADGAAGRPLKAHREGEPVIPACSTVALVLLGLDGIGAPLGPDAVHRPEEFGRITGLPTGSRVDAGVARAGLLAHLRHVPPHMRSVILLNKADGENRLRIAERVASELHASGIRSPILATSRGATRARLGPAVHQDAAV